MCERLCRRWNQSLVKTINYLACGFFVTKIELLNQLRKDAREERKSNTKRTETAKQEHAEEMSCTAKQATLKDETIWAKKSVTAKLGEVAKESSVLQTTEEATAGGDAAADNKQVTPD